MPADSGFMPPEDNNAIPPEKARAVVIPYGLEKTVSYEGGTTKGPGAIIECSSELEQFDEVFWSEPIKHYGIATLQQPEIPQDHEKALDHLAGIVEQVLEEGKFPLTLGGEHSLTPAAIRPFVKRHEQLTILQFDAHADLRDGYEGHHNSHASAMCRALDHSNVRLVSVGIRNISASEIPFLEANKERIDIFWAKDKKSWKCGDIADVVGEGPVYITFDVDGFDSSLMPATGTPEPGGIFWHETMDILNRVSLKANIVGADVVELAPRKGLHACDFLAAKLVYKILSYALLKKEPA
ncbi:MAG: agmatinase [Alphaproteobacteria bacterium]